MFDLIRAYQLDIMLGLSAACLCFALLLFITRFLERRRKLIMIFMEFVATFLLFSDRLAYIYSGDTSAMGYIMVRVSNFLVFLLTPAVVFGFNLYVGYLLETDAKIKKIPKRLLFVSILALVEMVLVAISQVTGLFYYFDENNVYHRGPGFIICYMIPVLAPLIQYTVIKEYKKNFSKLVYASLVIYIFIPILN